MLDDIKFLLLKMKNLKSKLLNGEAVHGCWLALGSPLTAEIVASAGFDWVLIDLEHGAGSEADVLNQLQAIAHTGAAGFVRVESVNRQRILRVLDMGAAGIMCPQVSTADEAKLMVDSMRFPPQGSRGIARFVRSANFGENFPEYIQTANDSLLGVAQIESLEALKHLDEIAATDGIDVLFIGPSDLSAALGIFAQFNHPLYIDTVKAIVAAAQKAGKATGILLANANDYATYYNYGIRMIACGADSAFVADSARALSSRLREAKHSAKIS
jgi:2-keto-3-deoxy-L-rhamnonate aldolase RhmA